MIRQLENAISATKRSLLGTGLKALFLRSSFIMGVGTVISKGFGFASKVILTRLLFPQEIGLMVMIIALTGFFEVLAEVGVKQSVIQNRSGAEPNFLNMAWWFQMVRAMGLLGFAYIASPWLCSFYFQGKPDVLDNHTIAELITMCRVAFLTILFNGIISPRAYILEKRFQFGKVVIINNVSHLLGTTITILLVLIYKSVWVMIVGFVVAAMAKCFLSYIICPFVPSLTYDNESFKEIMFFARGIFGLPILTYAIFNLDVFVVGKVFPAATVGMYGMAVLLAKTPMDLFGKVFLPLLLPVFARLQENTQRLRMVVVKAIWTTIGASLPICIVVIFFRKQILALVFGAEYMAVGNAFGFLSVYAVCIIISTILASVLFGIGRPGKHRLGMFIWTLIGTALIYPFISLFGLAGAPAALIVAAVCNLAVEWRIINSCYCATKPRHGEKHELGAFLCAKAE